MEALGEDSVAENDDDFQDYQMAGDRDDVSEGDWKSTLKDNDENNVDYQITKSQKVDHHFLLMKFVVD